MSELTLQAKPSGQTTLTNVSYDMLNSPQLSPTHSLTIQYGKVRVEGTVHDVFIPLRNLPNDFTSGTQARPFLNEMEELVRLVDLKIHYVLQNKIMIGPTLNRSGTTVYIDYSLIEDSNTEEE